MNHGTEITLEGKGPRSRIFGSNHFLWSNVTVGPIALGRARERRWLTVTSEARAKLDRVSHTRHGAPHLRVATASDRDAIAALHVDVWRATYRSLAPAAAYDALDEERRKPHWEELLGREAESSLTLVAEEDDVLVAFGHASPGLHPAMDGAGEIVHLYVRPDRQGLGLGRWLFDELAAFLAERGSTEIRLAVVDGNVPAIAFYERLGGRCVGRFTDGVLWRSENLVYAWSVANDSAAR